MKWRDMKKFLHDRGVREDTELDSLMIESVDQKNEADWHGFRIGFVFKDTEQ